ncbi:MAG: YrbI family 3-deoxy-D-manno-octulosonate 8-phosphate phosphatase [Cyclobacteriaceae bacterium]|jgi:YrbI family 3-deoxy-D-manno-octulosonate 8-phosphate phosphatase
MNLKDKCKKIKYLFTDVDGVWTDGGITYGLETREYKTFNVKDGFICHILIKEGLHLGIITGRKSEIVERRGNELKFRYIMQGVKDKLKVLKELALEHDFDLSEVAYIGDDLNDLDVMRSVGLSSCPADAFDYVSTQVNYVCQRNGGRGAFREFADLILKNR